MTNCLQINCIKAAFWQKLTLCAATNTQNKTKEMFALNIPLTQIP